MKVWMSQNTKNTNHYTFRLILPLIAMVVLLPIVTFGMMIFIKESGLSMELASTVTLIVLTIVIVCIALNMGKMANRDALIFCQDDEHNLFAVNARNFVSAHRGIYGYAKMASDVQKALKNIKDNQILERQMMQENSLTGLAPQIISVENFKPNNKGYSAVCKVRYPNGNTGKTTYLIENGYENQNELIAAFERKKSAYSPEVKVNYNPIKIIISLLALIACVAVCVMSHPAVGSLPEKIYFPFLGAAFVMLFPVTYFIVKQQRGE